jgi:hypothetical protein
VCNGVVGLGVGTTAASFRGGVVSGDEVGLGVATTTVLGVEVGVDIGVAIATDGAGVAMATGVGVGLPITTGLGVSIVGAGVGVATTTGAGAASEAIGVDVIMGAEGAGVTSAVRPGPKKRIGLTTQSATIKITTALIAMSTFSFEGPA